MFWFLPIYRPAEPDYATREQIASLRRELHEAQCTCKNCPIHRRDEQIGATAQWKHEDGSVTYFGPYNKQWKVEAK